MMPCTVALRIRLQTEKRKLHVATESIRLRIVRLHSQQTHSPHIPQCIDVGIRPQHIAGHIEQLLVVFVAGALGSNACHDMLVGGQAFLLFLAFESELLLGGSNFEAPVLLIVWVLE